jgi:hypothetical protein
VESNSVGRADALRARVEAACQGLLRFRAREHSDPVALMRKMEEAGWLDTPLPMLGGKTPRQAMRTASGRVAVDTLLKELEHLEAELPEWERTDYPALRAELGLAE